MINALRTAARLAFAVASLGATVWLLNALVTRDPLDRAGPDAAWTREAPHP